MLYTLTYRMVCVISQQRWYRNKAEGRKEAYPQTQSYQAISRALPICTVKSQQILEGKEMEKSRVCFDKLKKE